MQSRNTKDYKEQFVEDSYQI